MGQQTSETPNDNRDYSYSDTIFIGREKQQDDFRALLAHWQERMAKEHPGNEQTLFMPTPNNPIQGAVVLLFGRSGLGKSLLLNRYRNIALTASARGRKIAVGRIIDSETIIHRQIFGYPNTSEEQMIDPVSYYDALANAIASALGKELHNFKHFQHERKFVNKAQKKANRVLREMKQQGILGGMKQQDEFLGTVSDYIIDNAATLIRSYIPLSVLVLDLPALKNAPDEVKKQIRKKIAQTREYLRVRLGDDLSDYINPEVRLGPALGKDLQDWARNYPLLLLFDSYEEIDENDALLRRVMSAAGPRVGWILADKSNLWDAPIHTEHNHKYGYGDIVQNDLGLPVDFNAEKVGAFSAADIIACFTALSEKNPELANLPPLSSQDAKRILDATQGVPLAVKLAAELFYETGSMHVITDKVEGDETILDQMVNRYLVHTHANQEDCHKIYSLAMLRRADQPHAIVAALNLTPEEAETRYSQELNHLRRHYSFFFRTKNNSSLHPDVRESFRRWLLKRRSEPEIAACCRRLLQAQEQAMKAIEKQRLYTSLQVRLQDDDWTNAFLDLIEQQFWSDAVSGLKYLMSFVLADAAYRSNVNSAAIELGEFFSPRLGKLYRNWWSWANQCLHYFTGDHLSSEEMEELKRDNLKHLEDLIHQNVFVLPPFISTYTDELKDVLLAYLRLLQEKVERTYASEVDKNASQMYFRGLHTLHDQERRHDAENLLEDDAQLQSISPIDHTNLGIEHAAFERYEQAINEYSIAIKFDPKLAAAYHNRGLAHAAIKKYDEAIADYTQAVSIDPTYAIAYYNRGETFTQLRQFERAYADYSQAIQLDHTLAYNSRILDYLKIYQILYTTKHHDHVFHYNSEDIHAAWLQLWGNMGKQRENETMLVQLKNIAQIDEKNYVSYICRGISLAQSGKLKEGLKDLERAIELEPGLSDAYFWKGILCAYYYQGKRRVQVAMEALQKAVEVGLFPVFLTPLYWLETDIPDFFVQYAKPLLEQYGV